MADPGKKSNTAGRAASGPLSPQEKNRLLRLVAFALLAIPGVFSSKIWGGVTLFDAMSFSVQIREFASYFALFVSIALFELPLLRRSTPPAKLVRIVLPAALLFPLFFFPLSTPILLGYGYVVAWIIFRAAWAGELEFLRKPPVGKLLPRILPIAALLLIVSGVLAADDAFNRLYLLMSDWGIYAQIAFNTWHGEFLHHLWPVPGFCGSHLMPGALLPLAPLVGILPHPRTLFVINALVLFGSALLIFRFARKRGLPPGMAAALGFCYLLHPSVSNLNLCLFYGFNPVVFFIPLLIWFYECYEAKRFKTAFAIFLATLTLKETFGVFWAGWGMVTFLEGNRVRGILYAAIGSLWFLVALQWVIPSLDTESYIFFAQYSELGDGIFSILLSPILRPAAFWGKLFQLKNLWFLMILMLPFFTGAMNRFGLLWASSVLVVFNFVRGSSDIVNVAQQYQVETLTVFAIAMVLGVRRAAPRQWWPRILGAALTASDRRPGRLRFAMAAGGVAGAIIAFHCFGQSRTGMNTLSILERFADGRETMREIRDEIPAGASVAASNRLAAQLFFRNPVTGVKQPGTRFLLYDTGDGLGIPLADHAATLRDPQWKLRYRNMLDHRAVFLFERQEPAAEPETVDPWCRSGFEGLDFVPVEAKKGFPLFSRAVRRIRPDLLRIYLRLERPTTQFQIFGIAAETSAGDAVITRRFFADAAIPPERMEPGSVYAVDLSLPSPDAEILDFAVMSMPAEEEITSTR